MKEEAKFYYKEEAGANELIIWYGKKIDDNFSVSCVNFKNGAMWIGIKLLDTKELECYKEADKSKRKEFLEMIDNFRKEALETYNDIAAFN